MWRFFTTAVLVVISSGSFAESCSLNDTNQSCSASAININIGDPLIQSESREINNFLGVHALFWGVQTDLSGNTPSQVSPKAISILKSSGVGFIRYGGGVNEINWKGCIGPVADRPKQKLVSWSGPIRCAFGIAEYEKLNDELGLNSSWHMANVVGFEGAISPLDRLVVDAADQAKLIKQLAPNRKHYWELGNELDRNELQWQADKITLRDLPVAKAIIKNDPEAHLILPLLDYSPPWIKNADAHNHFLIQQHRSVVNNYALHLYYDNPPWGPSVANRLSAVRRIANIIQSEGVLDPSIWVTEHARPPPGTPADRDWQSRWNQTGDHDAVIASADFLIGLTQIPMVKGAAWHGLRAGPWNFIDVGSNATLKETRISRLFELFKADTQYLTLATEISEPAELRLPGSYSIRASAFVDRSDIKSARTVVWLVNRSSEEKRVRISKKDFNNPHMLLELTQTTMANDYNPNNGPSTAMRKTIQPTNGFITIILAAKSVSVINITHREM